MEKLAKKRAYVTMVEEINTEEIIKKYRNQLSNKINLDEESFPDESFSIEYKIFRKENLEKNLSRYENLCNVSEKILKVSPSKKDLPRIQDAINRVHLEINPEGAMSFAVLSGLSIMSLGILILLVSLLLK